MDAKSELRDEHEDLYGTLLAADQLIADAGTGWLLLAAVMVVTTLIVGLEVSWLDEVLGRDLGGARNLPTYGGIAVACFFLYGAVINLTESVVYRRHRRRIHDEVRRADLRWNTLLARTAGDASLEHVVPYLRKDTKERRMARS
jgi:hypothetical protein